MVKYVLTGATGGLGSQVLKYLLRLVPASDIIVSLYNPAGATPEIKSSGAEVRQGDFSQPDTLDSAFKGADKLLIVSYPSIGHENRVKAHIAAIDAAKRAGITHVYYTSIMYASDSKAAAMQAHLDTEKYLRESGLTYTIIKEGIYSEGFGMALAFWNPSRGSEVKIPDGDGAIAFVSREDLGEGTARLMVADTHKNEVVQFTGLKASTLTEVAELITSILHLEVPLRLKIVSVEEFADSNQGSKDVLTRWATTYPALKRGEMAIVDPLLREILGRDLKPLEETLREVLVVKGE